MMNSVVYWSISLLKNLNVKQMKLSLLGNVALDGIQI